MNSKRIYLSPPDIGVEEQSLVAATFVSNWIAPLGPNVDAFEREFADRVGAPYAVALSSGTAALHLALIEAGVGPGDVVLVSTLTFAASVYPVKYLGATPHFIDSERVSWNMDPDLLRRTLDDYSARGKLPKAVIAVHLYGQSADIDSIAQICSYHGVTLIEDAAEALGATYGSRAPGTIGEFGIFSFNGNKIITTSGGGMLITRDAAAAGHVRKLATQAREHALHYEHTEIGYNYRMSNVLAAIGLGQLRHLDDKVRARRRNFAAYSQALADVPGIALMPEAPWGRSSRWLTVGTINAKRFGASAAEVRHALEESNIEARPVWKPMHQQPVFADCPATLSGVADALFADGICLPSGSSLGRTDLARVVDVIKGCGTRSRTGAPVASVAS